jgi:APA family basic amino acid/polyamine antiporter
LLLVIIVGIHFLTNDPEPLPPAPAAAAMEGGATWLLVVQGAALAFFAFIGFEDMVNVAEEVESPHRNVPAAILTALVIAGGVYLVVAFIATAVVPPTELADSDAPLLEVVRRAAPGFPPWLFSLIALFAVANTGLLNCIMGSRLLYGMSEQRLLPAALRRVHAGTQTPYWAIVVILVAAIALALSGTLLYLAGTTSVLLLAVFATVNVSLVVVKLRQPKQPDVFRVPLVVPVLGSLSSLILIGFLPSGSLLTALGFVVFGLLLVVVWKSRNPT